MFEKLAKVQYELKAPKGQQNDYGGYKYRSCEDILEALKPLLEKYDASVVITDSIEVVLDRIYVKATAKFVDVATGDSTEVSAYAREPLTQKGMADSQLTGAASSYARKYALNGLFLIDDTKDADSNEYGKIAGMKNKKGETAEESEQNEQMIAASKAAPITKAEVAALTSMCEKKGLDVAQTFPNGIENLTGEQYLAATKKINGMKDKS